MGDMGGGGWHGLPGTRMIRRGHDPDAKLPKGIVRRVWATFARPYRLKLGVLLLLITVSSALTVVPARVVGAVVDTITTPPADAAGRITVLGAILLAVAVVGAALAVWQRHLSAWIGEHLILDLRTALFDHVQRMPVAFFTRTQTGALISRLNNDVVGAQRALTGTFGTLTANVVQVVATVGLMLTLSWQLTLLTLAVLPLFVVLAKWVGRRLEGLTRESMELNADMNTVMTERFNVAGAMLVKLFGRPREERDAFERSARRVADIGVETAVAWRVFASVLTVAGALGTAAVYLIGGRLALRGSMAPGDVVAFGLLVTQAYTPLSALSNAPVEVLAALVSFDRVFEVLDVGHPIRDADDAVDLPQPVRGRVEVRGVRFAYPAASESSLASLERVSDVLDDRPGPPVLRGVAFVAEPGQTVALVGPSGAGKSTLLSLVARLYDVTEGAVLIDGHDVRDLTLQSLAAAIGVVSQDPHLFHDTVRANLRYARPDATDEDIVAACRAAQIHDVLAALPDGYDTVVGERGYRLSGGEKQRVSIARVLLKDPAIVLLDEATSHLDSESEAAIQEALRTTLASRTSIVIAHRLSTIVGADQILVLDEGRIVQRGTHAQLVDAEGLYAVLYRTQFAAAGAR